MVKINTTIDNRHSDVGAAGGYIPRARCADQRQRPLIGVRWIIGLIRALRQYDRWQQQRSKASRRTGCRYIDVPFHDLSTRCHHHFPGNVTPCRYQAPSSLVNVKVVSIGRWFWPPPWTVYSAVAVQRTWACWPSFCSN